MRLRTFLIAEVIEADVVPVQDFLKLQALLSRRHSHDLGEDLADVSFGDTSLLALLKVEALAWNAIDPHRGRETNEQRLSGREVLVPLGRVVEIGVGLLVLSRIGVMEPGMIGLLEPVSEG
jgi:hypothetical protein